MKITLKPRITEKSYSFISEDKKKASRFTFKATSTTTKAEAAKTVEAMYKVHVTNVNVVKIPAKARRFKGRLGHMAAFKKFIVTLRPGEHIDAFTIESQS